MDSNSVNVRNRDDIGIKGKTEVISIEEVVKKLHSLKDEKRLENKLL